MAKLELEAQLRTVTGKKCRALRAKNIIPGQVYNTKHNTNIQFDEKTLQDTLRQAGKTSLIEIKVDGKIFKTLTREVQYSLNRQRITYADFYEVDMHKKITVTVPVKTFGTNNLIEKSNAIVVNGATSIDINILPSSIPAVIEVDISSLESFSDSIRSADIKLPQAATLVSNPNTMIVTCAETRVTRQQQQQDSDDNQEATTPEKDADQNTQQEETKDS